ncbi:MAG: NYN domain-containing protein [Massilia sp.]|nr:NYN domain-containing protein [Massilia sp.]
MASSSENVSMAVFCDFENVALGVRDANYEKFDIKPVLERLLLKGSIVVKKAYCDWERYKGFKSTMHEANFELIEIPHVRQSGKNSADIRLVVDALDLCYTKSHVNTFVIISGDSDFSPLVSKLRENNKQVIGVGVKQSTSDLLVANCDEFIFYDDLVREVKRAAAKRDERKAQPAAASAKRTPDEGNRRKEELEGRKAQAIEMVVEMFDALVSERGDSGKIWASLLKDTLKRRRPEFNETYFGFRTFGNLLEEAQARGMLEFGRDEKSGAYVYRSNSAAFAAGTQGEPLASAQEPDATSEMTPDASLEAPSDAAPETAFEATPERAAEPGGRAQQHRRGRGGRTDFRAPATVTTAELALEPTPAPAPDLTPAPASAQAAETNAQSEPRRRGRNGRTDFRAPVVAQPDDAVDVEAPAAAVEPVLVEAGQWNDESPFPPPPQQPRSPRGARKRADKVSQTVFDVEAEVALPPAAEQIAPVELIDPVEPVDAALAPAPAPKAARKPAARSRRPAKPKAAPEIG